MTNMIGKITGADWSDAPEYATHRALKDSGAGHKWLRKTKDNLYFYNVVESSWIKYDDKDMGDRHIQKSISREKDLGMTKQVSKQVKTIADLEVGMFLKDIDGTTRLVVMVLDGDIKTFNIATRVETRWTEDSFSQPDMFNSWSYTYTGEYTPIIKETAREKAIKAATQEIIQAQQALDKARSKLDEANKLD